MLCYRGRRDFQLLGVIHKRCPQERGEGVKQKRTPADMGGGGQAKLDVHIWLKFQI